VNTAVCFFLEETGRVRRSLRRYATGACPAVPHRGYHDASVPVDDAPAVLDGDGYQVATMEKPPREDQRWPRRCACGRSFGDDDPFQVFEETLYRRSDGGELVTIRAAPPGAMWYADWLIRGLDYSDPGAGSPWPWKPGPDGHCLVVRCPDGHDWTIDSRARNCTMPLDNLHYCWCRHGVPPKVTVNKEGCRTCLAGAGSIQTPNWHGFLRDGILTP
jgi:hypothetical protein